MFYILMKTINLVCLFICCLREFLFYHVVIKIFYTFLLSFELLFFTLRFLIHLEFILLCAMSKNSNVLLRTKDCLNTIFSPTGHHIPRFHECVDVFLGSLFYTIGINVYVLNLSKPQFHL